MGRHKSIRTEFLPKSSKDNSMVESSTKYVPKLLDNINIKIVSELVRQPEISSLALAKKLNIPLSTLQRRRAKVEKAIVKKTYTFNYKAFGARVGDLIINVNKGKSDHVAQGILKKYRNNVTYCHTRIDLTHSVLAHIIFKDTTELYYLIETINAMEYVNSLSWSETVKVIGDNNSEVISSFLISDH
jgi:DNA-binding Lrp family transcriptional regulator